MPRKATEGPRPWPAPQQAHALAERRGSQRSPGEEFAGESVILATPEEPEKKD